MRGEADVNRDDWLARRIVNDDRARRSSVSRSWTQQDSSRSSRPVMQSIAGHDVGGRYRDVRAGRPLSRVTNVVGSVGQSSTKHCRSPIAAANGRHMLSAGNIHLASGGTLRMPACCVSAAGPFEPMR